MAKANVLYAHLCENAFPSEGGKLNLIGIFGGLNNPGQINVPQFPVAYPRVALAIGLSTTETKLPLEITFRTEDGKDVVNPFSGTFEIDKSQAPKGQEAANVNFNLNFDSFGIEKAGKLFLTIESGEDELAELEINAVQQQQQQPPPQAT